MFSLAKRLVSNLTLIFALINFCQKNGLLQYSSWTHLGPSQILTVDHMLTLFSFPHQYILVWRKNYSPSAKSCNYCAIFWEASNESFGQKKPLVFWVQFLLWFLPKEWPCKSNINRIMTKWEFVRPKETSCFMSSLIFQFKLISLNSVGN